MFRSKVTEEHQIQIYIFIYFLKYIYAILNIVQIC